MRKYIGALIVAAAAVGMTPAANAALFTPGSANFQVFGDITSGTVTANLGNSGIAAGAFSDTFQFTIDQNGVGSGSLSTSTTLLNSVTDLDFTSVLINGVAATLSTTSAGLYEFAYASGISILSGVPNTIVVNGVSRGNGSYGGNATFSPVTSVPETATWAMMILGFGVVGAAMRSRRKSVSAYRRGTTNVSFA